MAIEFVPCGIEMRPVTLGLEIQLAESIVTYAYGTCLVVVVEQGHIHLPANLSYGFAYLLEPHAVDAPRRHITDAGFGTMLTYALNQRSQRVGEHLQRVATVAALVGIVVSGDDENVVCLRIYLPVALEQRCATPLLGSVECHATSVLADVLVREPEPFGHPCVPRLRIGALVVLDIGVADDREPAAVNCLLCVGS